jgi:hypothetical protein
MNVVHQDSVKLDSPGGINTKIERGGFVKKTHPTAVDDEAYAEQAIEEWRGRAGGHEGGGGEWDEARGSRRSKSSGETRCDFFEGGKVVGSFTVPL